MAKHASAVAVVEAPKSCVTSSVRALENELGRRDLIEFIKLTKSDYMVGMFHNELALALDQFLEDVIAGKSPRLMVFAPPRHGKTEEVSRRFPAYALGRYPDLSIIATSYSSDLASSINRDVQRVVDGERFTEIFPDTQLWGKNIRTVADGSYLRNSDVFEIVGHEGVYKSAGVGAGITGRGGKILLIDDPIKDAAEAHSITVRNSIWEWYQSTFYTRSEPGGGILIILTRWHQDDLAGRLLAAMKEGGEQWNVIKFPAIAEEDEYSKFTGELLRREGEALHPERYDLERLERIKLAVGSKVWASLFQQRPAAAEGNIFKRENWRFLRPVKPLQEMTSSERKSYFYSLGIRKVIQAWDTALGGKKKNDNTACTTLGIAPSRYYLIDVWQGKIQFPDVLKQVELLYDKWEPNEVIVEGGGSASGKATVQMLSRSTRIPFKEQTTVADKEFRADCISPTQEAGLVTIFEGGSWQVGFIDQCAGFPGLVNDDDVDSWMLAMERSIGKKTWNITQDLLDRIG